MQQSYLDTDIGKAEFKLLRDQDHVDYVWSVMEPIVNNYIDGFLDGIVYASDLPSPQDSFTAFLKKLRNRHFADGMPHAGAESTPVRLRGFLAGAGGRIG